MKELSELYHKALNKYSEIYVYREELNRKAASLYAKSIVLEPRSTDQSYANELEMVRSELKKVREDLVVADLVFKQIEDIANQFFKEHFILGTPKCAETRYIEFLHSSLYKNVLGGPSLDFKSA